MELRQLRHFLALVEERSITRAAKRELIVQSGLSNSLQALEREFGTPLYVREPGPSDSPRLARLWWARLAGP
jgi:DNA-binding transcriptional LysR family regulator